MSETPAVDLDLSDLDLEDISGVVLAPAATSAAVATQPTTAPAPTTKPTTTKTRTTTAKSMRQPLYFDLETVPDESRLELFGLEPLPVHPQYKVREECLAATEVISKTVPEMTTLIAEMQPCDEWLGTLELVERQNKARKGVLDLIGDVRKGRRQIDEAEAARIKKCSVTPEYCRIVAIGWAIGGGDLDSMCIKEPSEESLMLEGFWNTVKTCGPLVGYNIAGFDLPVIYARSILLGVEPQRYIDRKDWGPDVIDLMLSRFGRGGGAMGLKPLCRCYGIEVPAGDVDGGAVHQLVADGKWDDIAGYVKSDVHLVRELHRKFRGTFTAS